MRRSAFLADPPPDGAEVHESLKLFRSETERDGKRILLCKAWRGKQSKPFAFFRFRTEERRQEWMQEQREAETAGNVAKAERKQREGEQRAEFAKAMVPGAILHTSWGYDQTNVEFFEVVERPSPGFVVVREIGSDLEETCFMSGTKTPRPGCFLVDAPAMRKRIGAGSLKISDCRTAWLGDGPQRCSWYA